MPADPNERIHLQTTEFLIVIDEDDNGDLDVIDSVRIDDTEE